MDKVGSTTNSRSRKRAANTETSNETENNMVDSQEQNAAPETETKSQRSSSRNEMSSSPKSIGAVIAESLAAESQEAIDRGVSQMNDYVKVAKEYVSENPREAAGLAVAAGVAAWALLATKPGRHVFEIGAATLVPKAARWLSRNFASVQH